LGNVEATGGGAGAGAFIRAFGISVSEGGRRGGFWHVFLRVQLIIR
jgi:hypothetical protein